MPERKLLTTVRRTIRRKRSFAPPLTRKAYVKGFETFSKISNEWDSMMRWLRSDFLGKLSPKGSFSVLSVGSGNGNFDLRLIEMLRGKFKRIRYTAIEPNKTQSEKFRAKIRSSDLSRVHVELRTVPFENYTTGRRFDLIHLTHCLYYIPDRRQAVIRARELLADSGKVLIFHQTPAGINEIQRRFLKEIKGDAKEMFSSKEIQQMLELARIPYQVDLVESFLDITDHFGFDTEPAMDLLGFFLESNVRGIVPSLKRRIVDHIRGMARNIQGRRLLFHPVAIFSITKE